MIRFRSCRDACNSAQQKKEWEALHVEFLLVGFNRVRVNTHEAFARLHFAGEETHLVHGNRFGLLSLFNFQFRKPYLNRTYLQLLT
jgi:hypothetical protein